MASITPYNDFIKRTDKRLDSVANYRLPETWWSRAWEYAWALDYAAPAQIVADLGCGWHYRPFKDALAEICGTVYAVDAHPGVLDLHGERPFPDNMNVIVGDMTTVQLPPLDRIFCISVLEDLGENTLAALRHFEELLAPGGLIVLTFDSQYDMDKPLGKYPGVQVDKFLEDVRAAGLTPVGDCLQNKDGALFNEGFNLAVYHCLLVRA